MYNPRLGRWALIDPMESTYPGIAPYAYVAGSPINAIDPDGRLVVFVNGYRLGDIIDELFLSIMGMSYPSEEEYLRGYQTIYTNDAFGYWGKMDRGFKNRIGDHNAVYFDASNHIKSTAQRRYEIGVRAGKDLLKAIKNGQVTLKPGESIKVVAHSQGAAYAIGLASVFEPGTKIEIEGQLVDMPRIEVIYAIAAKQPEDIPVPGWIQDRVRLVQYVSSKDWIATDGQIRGNDGVWKHPNGGAWIDETMEGGNHTVKSYWRIFDDIQKSDPTYIYPRLDNPLNLKGK